jgi:hypothetical protein
MSNEAAEPAENELARPTITIAEREAESGTGAAPAIAEAHSNEEVSYQAVEKEGTVTAIWEMQGRKHLRTIDPRSNEGKQILALFETAG